MPDADPRARQIIARAWKDEEYRSSLPPEVREKLPPKPEGASTMTDDQLEAAAGGTATFCAAAAAAAIGYGVSEIVD
jgi:mersacidin/lichenicidin family type 2 lantibiotic